MQSLEFDDLRIEIFAPHAPSLASAMRAQPLRSTPDTPPDTSASAQIVSLELGTPPIFAQDDPPAVPSSLSAQAISSEPSASAAPNTPLVTSIAPVSRSSLAAPKAQAIQPAVSSALDIRPVYGGCRTHQLDFASIIDAEYSARNARTESFIPLLRRNGCVRTNLRACAALCRRSRVRADHLPARFGV